MEERPPVTHSTAEQHKQKCIAVMGEELGSQYAELWQEVVYLHKKWMEYIVSVWDEAGTYRAFEQGRA